MKHVIIPIIIFVFGPVALFLGSGLLSGNSDKMEYMLIAAGIWLLLSVGKVRGDRGDNHLKILEFKADAYIAKVISKDTLAYKNISAEVRDVILSWTDEQSAAKWNFSFDYDRAALIVAKKTLLKYISQKWTEETRLSAYNAYKFCLLQQYRRLDITKDEYEQQLNSIGGIT